MKTNRKAQSAVREIAISNMPWNQRKRLLETATTYAEVCRLSRVGDVNLVCRVLDVTSHRNGISGAPFHTVCFDSQLDDGSVARLMATIFVGYESEFCAVVRCSEAGAGLVESCFRGDNYAPFLARIIRLAD
jgi:hypothetical protein